MRLSIWKQYSMTLDKECWFIACSWLKCKKWIPTTRELYREQCPLHKCPSDSIIIQQFCSISDMVEFYIHIKSEHSTLDFCSKWSVLYPRNTFLGFFLFVFFFFFFLFQRIQRETVDKNPQAVPWKATWCASYFLSLYSWCFARDPSTSHTNHVCLSIHYISLSTL